MAALTLLATATLVAAACSEDEASVQQETALQVTAPSQPIPRAPWTLARLGYGPIDFLATTEAEVVQSVPFSLPANATQGEVTWYVLRMRYRLELDPSSGPGRIYLIGAVNGSPAAMQTYIVGRDSKGLKVRSTELGLVSGFHARTSRDLVFERRFENYIPYRGVRPGASTISFKLEQYNDARIKSLRVYPNSGVLVTSAGPASLTVEPTILDREIRVGDTFPLRYRVVNRGGRRVLGGRLTMISLGPLRIEGPKQVQLPPIGPNSSVRGHVRVHAEATGLWPISLVTESSFGSAHSTVDVKVLP